MSGKFKRPGLPRHGSQPQLPGGGREGGGAVPERPQTFEQVYEKYEAQAKKVSKLIGLSDATGSMAGVWDATRRHITEMIGRISELGRFELRWVAYRDYGDGNGLLEPSGWHDRARPLLDFINAIRCYGGDDFEEAVERALEFAADDPQATRVILIGDAPPHPERDYLAQARRLAELRRPVFSFVVGQSSATARAFAEISRLTGGQSAQLTRAEDLLDVVVLTAAEEIGGEEAVREYVRRWAPRLSEDARRYAGLLLGEGGTDG